MGLSRPSWSGAAIRVFVGVVLVAVVAIVIVWERRVVPLPTTAAVPADEPLRIEAAADSTGALALEWRPDPRADAYELELLDARLAVVRTFGPLREPRHLLAFDAVPEGAAWCRVVALRRGERLGESPKLELWRP